MATATPIVNHDVEKNAGGEDMEQRISSEMPLEGAESISDSDTIMQSRRDSDASSSRTASIGNHPKKSVELAVVEKKPQTVAGDDTPITLPVKRGSKVTRYLFCKYSIDIRVYASTHHRQSTSSLPTVKRLQSSSLVI